MSTLPKLSATETDLEALAAFEGRIVLLVAEPGQLTPAGRRLSRLTRGAVERLVAAPAFAKLKPGEGLEMAFPAGLAAEAVQVIRLDRRASAPEARTAGATIAAAAAGKPVLVLAATLARIEDLALGLLLRSYSFTEMKSKTEDATLPAEVRVMCNRPDDLTARLDDLRALAAGVHFTRDLVNLPANVLTTTSFAEKLSDLDAFGVEVEVMDEDRLAEVGMHMLLGVGQGSASPSKVVVMQWKGGAADAAPLALIGKGVVFDTGGISIKPAAGMEEMTMDMGGAGVVAGVMRTLALRKAPANVVAVVGLVENMPSSTAQRPGDVVKSLKGDTVEVINTDAEGRLVLGDIMWYAAERFKPAGMVDLATLTGAIIVALGHENAGVFSNDDPFADAFLAAARSEGEGAWRMPLGTAYAKLLESRIADVKNVGGRPAGSVTAAEFLHRFVPEGLPWIHLDIAGVALPATPTPVAPKGASGWGVLALDRLVRNKFEAG